MIAVIVPIVLLAVSLCLMIGAVAGNQIDPDYSSALAVPLANLGGLVVALLALAIAFWAYGRDKDSKLARRTLLATLVCAVVLGMLLPLSDLGHLSRVH